MFFSSSKFGQTVQILASGALGQIGINTFTPPTAGEIESFVHIVVQVIVGVVTIYATVRKMYQHPETVVQLPAAVVVTAALAVPVTEQPAATPSDPADGIR
ncbi:hypothetical protein [Hymenobacter siberiensis]|uniref:hypothetical protein n=1 Tax=Hymenobacter siberiensis TaxID=2848396 RepID=UPI001C1DDC6D|nr:hypothetical protein [Hymenobacter siberiensis]MBU6122257.1 hypothetical protein [Hymenobacter siberiensis]